MKWVMVGVVAAALVSGTVNAADKPETARLSGFKEMMQSAQKGNPVAQNNLGVMYATGNGTAKDFVAAAQWYEKSAGQGYAVAQHNLGGLYEQGLGVPLDPGAAAVWYALAADQGDGWAQVSLAELHAEHKIDDADLATAYRWLLIASNSREADIKAAARKMMDPVAKKLTPASRSEAEKMAKAWRPANR